MLLKFMNCHCRRVYNIGQHLSIVPCGEYLRLSGNKNDLFWDKKVENNYLLFLIKKPTKLIYTHYIIAPSRHFNLRYKVSAVLDYWISLEISLLYDGKFLGKDVLAMRNAIYEDWCRGRYTLPGFEKVHKIIDKLFGRYEHIFNNPALLEVQVLYT